MLSLQDNRRYFLYQSIADMRKSFNGLSALVKQQMGLSLLTGDVFIFINKRRNQVKLLSWDNDGLCVFHKRLERGTFEIPQSRDSTSVTLTAQQLRFILEGIQLQSVKQRLRFKLSA
jgi:transposase